MKLGICMFGTDYAIRVDELAQEAESRGFESLWLPEHTHIPSSRKTPFPGGGDLPKEYSHTLDPFVALSAAAARTRTIKLATGICLIAQHDTLVLAKEIASLDLLSNGRFLFGIGGGWNVEEMNHHGVSYDTRFARLEEQVEAMRLLWTEDEAEYHGDHVDFEPSWSWPKPVQKPGPPVLLGGFSGYTRDRVVRFCDGWLPIGISAKAILKGLDDLWQRAEEAQRDRDTIDVTIYGSQPDDLPAYRDAGVNRAVLWVPPKGRDDVLPLLDRYAQLLDS